MEITMKEVFDLMISGIPGAPYSETVDTLKTGDPNRKVTGIVVTFLASYEVIQQAIASGANLIITHEPTFYNHLDNIDWLKDDAVYQAKRKLIEENQLTIWRFHDYLHSLQPDPTLVGLLKRLGWINYAQPDMPFVCQMPPRKLSEFVSEIKAKLGLSTVRVVGDMQMTCQRVGILVGACPGDMQIRITSDQSLDLLVAGEINEWETSEYVRDSSAMGKPTALIVTGHSISEEDGMLEIVPWLQARFPEIPVTHIPTGHALVTI